MDVFWSLMLILPFHQAAAAYTQHNKAAGGSVTFTIQYQQNHPVAWSFNNEVMATVTPGHPPEISFFERPRKHWAFSKNGSALSISHLGMEDAGTYVAKGLGIKSTFTLHVYRKLPMPRVMCLARNCSSQSCLYTLRCAVGGSDLGNVSYSWMMEGRPLVQGPTVLLEEVPLVTCRVENPISCMNITVTSLAALCGDNTTHPPDTGTSSRQVGIIVGSVVGIGVVLAIVTVTIVYCKSKGWRIFHLPVSSTTNIEAEVHYSTVYDCVGSSHQVPLQRVPNARRDHAGTQDPLKTIYSTVHSLTQTDDEKTGHRTPRCLKQDERSIYSRVSDSEPAAQHRRGVSMNLL